MELGVHNYSMDTSISKHILSVLEQSYPSSALTEFFFQEVNIFKRGSARLVV
jgi:hypothetical protein